MNPVKKEREHKYSAFFEGQYPGASRIVCGLFPANVQSLAMAVGKVYHADATHSHEYVQTVDMTNNKTSSTYDWKERGKGLIIFIKDYNLRTFKLYTFDVDSQSLRSDLEEEFYGEVEPIYDHASRFYQFSSVNGNYQVGYSCVFNLEYDAVVSLIMAKVQRHVVPNFGPRIVLTEPSAPNYTLKKRNKEKHKHRTLKQFLSDKLEVLTRSTKTPTRPSRLNFPSSSSLNSTPQMSSQTSSRSNQDIARLSDSFQFVQVRVVEFLMVVKIFTTYLSIK